MENVDRPFCSSRVTIELGSRAEWGTFTHTWEPGMKRLDIFDTLDRHQRQMNFTSTQPLSCQNNEAISEDTWVTSAFPFKHDDTGSDRNVKYKQISFLHPHLHQSKPQTQH